MASPFINYAPPGSIGPKVIAAAAVPVPSPWIPAGIKGFEKRVLPGGAIEMRSVAGTLPAERVTPPAMPTKAIRKDPPYVPEGFAGFEYHSANGKVAKFVRPADVPPKDPILVKLEALDEKLAADDDMRSRLVDHRGGCTCFISPPCHACCEPLTAREADALGWLEDDAEVEPITSAPMTWQDGAPPSVGWYESTCAQDYKPDGRARYWDGLAWSTFCWGSDSVDTKQRDMSLPTKRLGIKWRGPRLTGARWPEATAT